MDLSGLKTLLAPIWRPLLVLAIAIVIVGGFLVSYGERAREAEREQPVSPPQRVSTINGETAVTLDPAAQKAVGIEVAPIRNAPQPRLLRAYGIAVDPSTLSDLHNNYVNAEAQLGMARAKLHQSQLAFTRSERLLAAQAVSLATRDDAEAAYRVDQATVSAAQSQLQTLDSTAQQNWGARLGSAIIKGEPVFQKLAARQDVLVQMSLPPGQVLVHPPDSAIVQLENGTRISATYLSDAPKTDVHIQGASYFYVASANAGLLPGMNLSVSLPSDRTITGAFVPSSAVVWWQGKAWVYVHSGRTQFIRRAVAGDALAGDGRYVVTGLQNSDAIVIRGAQVLLSEEFRPQVPAGGEDHE